ncbi:hypothetical protein EGI11_05635 [Chryseobacterium sp. H3056]|uniref:Uncharacterized protein n=2 Tax=Kaistella daneshvariae TaxID=2487074 RepID=A0A3N0WVY7_9FLAO|nr:hypothetical protein EGI11_05635 [Kaistella daneshvariae]
MQLSVFQLSRFCVCFLKAKKLAVKSRNFSDLAAIKNWKITSLKQEIFNEMNLMLIKHQSPKAKNLPE